MNFPRIAASCHDSLRGTSPSRQQRLCLIIGLAGLRLSIQGVMEKLTISGIPDGDSPIDDDERRFNSFFYLPFSFESPVGPVNRVNEWSCRDLYTVLAVGKEKRDCLERSGDTRMTMNFCGHSQSRISRLQVILSCKEDLSKHSARSSIRK
jgi:hypothetical protein